MNYCTTAQLRGEFAGYDEENNDRLSQAVEFASRIIDLHVAGVDGDNYFAPPPAQPTEKEFFGSGINSLPITRHIKGSVTDVECENLVFQHDWKVIKNEIYFVDDYGSIVERIKFPENRIFTVTARWGWSAVPKQIEQATIAMAVELLRDGSSIWSGVVGGIKVAANLLYKKPLPPEVQSIVEVYKADFETSQITFV